MVYSVYAESDTLYYVHVLLPKFGRPHKGTDVATVFTSHVLLKKSADLYMNAP